MTESSHTLKKRDVQTGQIAVIRGLLTEEQLDECLEEQEKDSKAGKPIRPISVILIAKGYLNVHALLSLLNESNLQVAERIKSWDRQQEGVLFGRQLVRMKLATAEQVCHAILHQAEMAEKGEPVPSLGHLLVERGFITLEHLNEAVRSLSDAQLVSSVPGAPVIPGFELFEKLGQGGMGAVYRAQQLNLKRDVAIKVLLPQFSADEEYVKRFQREARAAAALEHPNIVRTYDVGCVPDAKGGYTYYLVMEHVRGRSLSKRLKEEGKIPEEKARHYVTQTARALDYCHRHGFVHRDVKPENILVDDEDVVKLTDLGLARKVDSQSHITQTGIIMGSPFYISPEQAMGTTHIDIRSDIYSLGATFYHLVTGEPPFTGSEPPLIMAKHLNEQVPSPRSKTPTLTMHTCKVILQMMAKNPNRRYQTPQDLLNDLAGAPAEPQPVSGPAPAPAPTPAAGVAVVGAAAAPSVPSPAPVAPAAPPPIRTPPVEAGSVHLNLALVAVWAGTVVVLAAASLLAASTGLQIAAGGVGLGGIALYLMARPPNRPA